MLMECLSLVSRNMLLLTEYSFDVTLKKIIHADGRNFLNVTMFSSKTFPRYYTL